MITDHSAFIRANTKLSQVPLVPHIKLYLADEALGLWQKTEDEMERGLGPPPFWAFAWAGGQALARYISDNPLLVRDKKILDFAAGSGVAGIAAALAGASLVEANDIEIFSSTAIELNAIENAVTINMRLGDLVGCQSQWDVVFAGDVAYQRDISDPIMHWLEDLAKGGTLVLIGDPGRAYLPREKLRSLATYDVPVPLALEDVAIKRTDVWSFI